MAKMRTNGEVNIADVKTVAGNTVTQLAMTQKHSNLQNVLAKVQKEHKEKLGLV